MYTSTIVSAVLAATAIAAPAVAAPATPKLVYALKTHSDNAYFHDKCIVGYHTGAGLADATLGPCTKSSQTFYSNGSAIESTQFGNAVPSGLQVITATSTYNDWLPVTINAGYGSQNLNYTAFGYEVQSDGAGFLACRWAHGGVSQLFSVISKTGLVGFTLPSSCAVVTLYHA